MNLHQTKIDPLILSGRDVTAVLGPTNTGKTHLAIERMVAHESGVIGLPGSYFGPDQDRHLRLAFANADAAALSGLPRRLAGLVDG